MKEAFGAGNVLVVSNSAGTRKDVGGIAVCSGTERREERSADGFLVFPQFSSLFLVCMALRPSCLRFSRFPPRLSASVDALPNHILSLANAPVSRLVLLLTRRISSNVVL